MIADNSKRESRIGVVGAGLGGLAAAATLAARGYRVTCFDQNPWVGGKAAQLHGEGPSGEKFRFDMGPTILTVPKVLERIFAEAGRDMHDYLELVRLDPQWRCFFDDGTSLDLREDIDAMKRSIEQWYQQEASQHPGRFEDYALVGQNDLQEVATNAARAFSENDGIWYEKFIRYTERLHRISDEFFFWKPISGIKDMMDVGGAMKLDTLKDVLAMRMGRSVTSTIGKFIDDKRLAQMLEHFTQYVGSCPSNSPAILCGIASMQTNEGVWYPVGGTRAVPEAMRRLGEELGVEYRVGEGVQRIAKRDGRVVGVVLDDGEQVSLDAVVSNMDAVRTRHELVDGDHRRAGMVTSADPEPACSGVVLYLGLNKAYDHLAHHDFVFSRDPEEEFDAIYQRGEPAPDPTAYLAAPGRTEKPGEVAPPGGEALYVLVHTPYLRPHHDWSKDGQLFRGYRQTILDKLKRTAGMPDLEERIVFEQALTPQDIHDRYRVLNGAIYGLASHGLWTGAFKPGNRSDLARGLYLAGGAAHPGPGMPMVMMSGWIAADTLDRDGLASRATAALG